MIYFSVSDLSYERDILASLFTEYSKLVTIHAVATQFILSNLKINHLKRTAKNEAFY